MPTSLARGFIFSHSILGNCIDCAISEIKNTTTRPTSLQSMLNFLKEKYIQKFTGEDETYRKHFNAAIQYRFLNQNPQGKYQEIPLNTKSITYNDFVFITKEVLTGFETFNKKMMKKFKDIQNANIKVERKHTEEGDINNICKEIKRSKSNYQK